MPNRSFPATRTEPRNGSMRLDKWLWHARFFRGRGDAAAFCEAGKLRIAGQIVHKAHYGVRPGDVLTFPLGRDIRVIRVVALAQRRGSAEQAAGLYVDLAPPSRNTEPNGAADYADLVSFHCADRLAPGDPSGKTRI